METYRQSPAWVNQDLPEFLWPDLPWGERAMLARFVAPAICVSLWLPTEYVGMEVAVTRKDAEAQRRRRARQRAEKELRRAGGPDVPGTGAPAEEGPSTAGSGGATAPPPA